MTSTGSFLPLSVTSRVMVHLSLEPVILTEIVLLPALCNVVGEATSKSMLVWSILTIQSAVYLDRTIALINHNVLVIDVILSSMGHRKLNNFVVHAKSSNAVDKKEKV